MKKYLIVILSIICVGIAVWFIFQTKPAGQSPSDASTALVPPLPASPLDATYRIDEREVTLVSGLSSEEIAPGSASREETRVWGEPVMGDVNGDGNDDAVLLLTQTGGGSGTFFYLSVALAVEGGYLGMNSVLLGDRISPETIEVHDEIITVNYAERTPDQSFADAPSQAVSARITLVGADLIRVPLEGNGIQVLPGYLAYSNDTYTFTPCGEALQHIASSSRSLAALKAIYTERKKKDLSQTIYIVVAGTMEGDVNEGASTNNVRHITISQILSVPRNGSCIAPAPPLTP